MISKKELLDLAKVNDNNCVSIFIPTHRGGEEVLEGKDVIRLKNQLQEVKATLSKRGMRGEKLDNYLKPIRDLLDDTDFWRNQSDGLALFLTHDIFRKYTIPVYFEAFNYVSHEFYLKPILPLFNGDRLFYLLALEKDAVQLYECTKHSVAEVKIDDLVPAELEAEVGYDYEQKGIQFRTQQGNRGEGSFHGHQDLDTNEKTELKDYFRAINDGVSNLLKDDREAPLVICGLDHYHSIYQEVNSHPHLYPKPIAGNPSDRDILMLHEKACNLLEPYFEEKRKHKKEVFRESPGTERVSTHIEQILPAAFEGKVDTLFVENRSDVYGIYNPDQMEVRIDDELTSSNTSLTNLLAMQVVNNGGKVYLNEKEQMPVSTSSVNALYRY